MSPHPVLRELAALEVDGMTPEEAAAKLKELRRRLDPSSQQEDIGP